MNMCMLIQPAEANETAQVVRKTESLVDQKYLRDFGREAASVVGAWGTKVVRSRW